MSKKINKVANANNSSVAALVSDETKKRANGKVSANVDGLKNSALLLDEAENDSPKKKEVFKSIRELFGFAEFDREAFLLSMAKDLADGKITAAEFFNKQKEVQNEINSTNKENENLTFENICGVISLSSVFGDFSKYVGGVSDLLTLKNRLISNDGKVILYHGSQSEDGEKFAPCKVTVKGLHKPFIDYCYTSTVDYCTSNILRAFRCYGYYLASVKRCNKQREKENNLVSRYQQIKKELHETYGYMPEDFATL